MILKTINKCFESLFCILQLVGLQVVEKVLSEMKHLFQCCQYQVIGVVVELYFLVVVLHQKNAVW